ncbi:uncharacterized protein Ecym_8268 [Eremothecium cymbalariae DBVPG|uniref:Peroxisomal membrane protein PEX14-like KPWE domain-containing protein n=1 Tax=Eremothecium cymbalariae (strain CBS 270.75 / DBVPG 7215 / KCTC 17166 / NRRL Y-17582) TaxID=931890 RepID=G8JXH6_ERECY|nr:Hypothetical protein Ecym_8268 [Eremothecium cymbalariae DBVPG\
MLALCDCKNWAGLRRMCIDNSNTDSHLGAANNLSYDDLVDIIMNDKPVPNAVEVEEVILDESCRTKSQLQPRPKPWEAIQPSGKDIEVYETGKVENSKDESSPTVGNHAS